jgi:hypothetical protein
MRRLHPRGHACRGIAVDRDGAMLGPDYLLVQRTPAGFRCLSPSKARAIQTAVFATAHDPDFLFEQTHRIAEALGRGELALARSTGSTSRSTSSMTLRCANFLPRRS